MRFFVKRRSQSVSLPSIRPLVVLQEDNWNDYSFTTLFHVSLYLIGEDEPRDLGDLKVMRLGQEVNEKTFSSDVVMFKSLSELEGQYCSLADSFDYYENLKSIGDIELSTNILDLLCDISYNQELLPIFENDECFNTSLLRYLTSKEILDKGTGIFKVRSKKNTVKVLKFDVDIPMAESKSYSINFDFNEYKGLPHRANLLVGANGVGKTQVMARLAILLSRFGGEEDDEKELKSSNLIGAGYISPRPSLYNVVAVSFNAFDSFELPSEKSSRKFRYSYCGLRDGYGGYLTEDQLVRKIEDISNLLRRDHETHVFKTYESKKCEFQATKYDYFERCLLRLIPNYGGKIRYDKLSAGQKIVVNILLHVLEKVSSQSLLLLDEPETHLHPKLMTTLYLILMEILEAFDSFAIIATHSPIVVQQVPSRSIKVLQRIEDEPVVVEPLLECFGENLSEISRNIFQTSESDRDYKAVIDELLASYENDVDTVEALFNGRLGMNASIYLRSKAYHND